MRWHGWITGVLGVWLTLTAYIELGESFMFWNNLVIGFFLFYSSILLSRIKLGYGWLLLIIGIYMILTAMIPGFQSGILKVWNGRLAGLVIAVLGFASLRDVPVYPAYERSV